MASTEFRRALRTLRLKFNLSQQQVAKVAGIEQTRYSGFETGKIKLDLDSADNLSKKVWGVCYTEFVSFSKTEIDISKLPSPSQKIIERSKNVTLNDSSNLLASELDRLIGGGHLNTPITSKILHSKMDKKLANRKSIEITSLLGRAPRNKNIVTLGESKSPKIFIHKDFASRYEKLTNEELVRLIMAEEKKMFEDKTEDVNESKEN